LSTADIGLPGSTCSVTRNVKKAFQEDQARATEAGERSAAKRAKAARRERGERSPRVMGVLPIRARMAWRSRR
jgi:hypothetical protein